MGRSIDIDGGRLLELLERIEFLSTASVGAHDEGYMTPCCPECKGEDEKHTATCDLASLIAYLKESL